MEIRMRFLSSFLLLVGVLCPYGQVAIAQSVQREPAWLDGSWTKLRIRLSGQVVDPSGQPVTDCRIVANMDSRSLKVRVEGSKFTCWVPAGESSGYVSTFTRHQLTVDSYADRASPACTFDRLPGREFD